jgi:hypothetical protein
MYVCVCIYVCISMCVYLYVCACVPKYKHQHIDGPTSRPVRRSMATTRTQMRAGLSGLYVCVCMCVCVCFS